ncbi:hypothetical protein [Halocynthiibacter namhaensis]|uniref:hypothetical protein n=1 Tax=Halocynthiibacter namhaensis TaxID=1290553 RepID=UPI0012E04609|nr:hypothetical protein [Halocynthiibacter namhaensis]
MTDIKVTIRGVDQGTWEEMRAIHHHTGVPYGRLVTQALQAWITQLPEPDRVYRRQFEPPRFYRRVKHSKGEPYDKEETYPRLSD